MEYTKLGNTDLEISKICLGSMNWGEQNNQKQAHRQLDLAREMGVNFIDTAELYAIPIKAKTQGKTETYIGKWLKKQKREEVILATKAAGPMPALEHIREGPNFSEEHLVAAIKGSLERLQTDYLDIYQLHWPERSTNFFGPLGYTHTSDDQVTDFKRVLEILRGYVRQGIIRYIGISNETPWGLMQFLKYADEFDLPRVASIQNPYSLLNRTFEVGLSEMCQRENIACLPYSPLAGGLLTGKYENNAKPESARYTLYPNYFSRYSHPNTLKATKDYVELAKKLKLTPTQMSLAFVNSRDFVTSTIIGASKEEQLRENIESIDIKLSEEALAAIEKIHLNFPNPAP